MISGLPELFGKSFAIGFLFPAAAVGVSAFGVLAAFGLQQQVLAILSDTTMVGESSLLGAALALILIWFLAIALMGLNRSAIRCLEGYGRLNPVRLLMFLERRRFARLKRKIDEIDAAKSATQSKDPRLVAEETELRSKMAASFPDDGWLLPTRFGNTIRAFEVYPRVIYDLEGIQGWSRLAAVIPEEFARTIAETKAQMDFWVNLLFGGWAVALIYAALAIWTCTLPLWWIPILALSVTYLASVSARSVAGEWGELVRSAFDLYRGDLCKQLGFEMPRSIEAERRMWRTFSKVAIYRDRDRADRFTGFRPLSKDGESD